MTVNKATKSHGHSAEENTALAQVLGLCSKSVNKDVKSDKVARALRRREHSVSVVFWAKL